MKRSIGKMDEFLDICVAAMRDNVAPAEQIEEAASRVLRNLKSEAEKVSTRSTVDPVFIDN
jgi:hypothetical protein